MSVPPVGVRAPVARGKDPETAKLDRAMVKTVMYPVTKHAKACYNILLVKNSSLEGRLIVDISIAWTGAGREGRVTEVRMVKDELSSQVAGVDLLQCVVDNITILRFPNVPRNAVQQILRYPFVFRLP